MVRNVEGDSEGTLDEYYRNSVTCAKNEIDSKGDDFIRGVETDELVNYYVNMYGLPLLEIDSSNENIMEKTSSANANYQSGIRVKVGIPIIQEDGIDKVVANRANPYQMGVHFQLENGYLVTYAEISGQGQGQEQNIQQRLKTLQIVIGQKNNNVSTGNTQLKQQINEHIVRLKDKLKSEDQVVEAIVQKMPIKLIKKQNGPSTINLKIKKKIQPIMPEARGNVEPYLEGTQVVGVIELLSNQGKQFEVTPEVYSKFEEEHLRDVMLGMLNAVYEGGATGETFSKTGKTDIHLKLSIKGGILTGECKIWRGEQQYKETIDQHFGYINWRQNFAIQITFSPNKGFSDVIMKATEAATAHPTYLKNSYKKIDESHFITLHTFPEDPKKQVEIHHLLFNLYYEKDE